MTVENISFQEKVWLNHYNNLIAFQEETSKPYPGPKDEQVKLYHWCKNQRRFYKSGNLQVHRKELLDKIDFRWITSNISFDDRLVQLLNYRKKHGSLHVSQVGFEKDSENHKLSRWINEMRRLYNENRLPIDRINKLNKVDFIWNMEDERFANNLQRLKKFYKENNSFDVPQSGRTKKLGEWVAQIRCRGLVKKHYVEALNEIGFVWVGKKKRIKNAKETMTEIDIYSKLGVKRKKTRSKPVNV